jgi:hypothetical protein
MRLFIAYAKVQVLLAQHLFFCRSATATATYRHAGNEAPLAHFLA